MQAGHAKIYGYVSFDRRNNSFSLRLPTEEKTWPNAVYLINPLVLRKNSAQIRYFRCHYAYDTQSQQRFAASDTQSDCLGPDSIRKRRADRTTFE